MNVIKTNICNNCLYKDNPYECNKENHKTRCKYAKKEQLKLNKKLRQNIEKVSD